MKLILFIIVVAIIYVGYRNSSTSDVRIGGPNREIDAEGPAQEVGKVIDRGLNVAGKMVEKAGQKIQDVTQDVHATPTPRAA